MGNIHRVVGLSIGAVFGLIALWGLFLWIRNADPGQTFWRVLAAGQLGLVLQALVGIVMFFVIGGMPILHYAYGIFPVLVLLVAHKQSKKFEGLEWVAFAIAGLVIFGLQTRGFMTGLEI
ncbi:MAG: hypothetical protein ACT4OM_11315 [Actinomycetota bacterium]